MDDNRHDQAIERLLGPTGYQVTCEECFELLDEYVELGLEVEGLNADVRIPGMRTHLAGCSACHEEHDSLRALVGSAK
jgi:hypothetical protein